MTARTRMRTAAILTSAIVAVGCSGASDDDPGTGIPEQDPELVTVGEVAYQAHCAECHGTDLRGTDQGPSHLSIVYEPNHHGDVAFVFAAQTGVPQHHWPFGNMEPLPDVGEEDLWAIVAYVRENQRVQGFEPYPP